MALRTRGRAPPRQASVKQGRVLVVEDNVDTRAGLKDALEGDGFEVFATGDGRQALDQLRSQPKPDALLLDLYMPDLNGFEIYHVLRDDPNLSTIPVILVTAASPAHRTGLDVAATIRKPLDVQELLLTVRGAIATAGLRPLPAL